MFLLTPIVLGNLKILELQHIGHFGKHAIAKFTNFSTRFQNADPAQRLQMFHAL